MNTETVNSSIPGQDCNFTPNISVNETGVREEYQNRSHPVDGRSPEESVPGRSEMSFFVLFFFFFSKFDLPHSAVKCLRKEPSFSSGVLVLKFDGDGFHFGVFGQCIFTQFSAISRHFEATKWSLCVDGIVAVDPDSSRL